MRKTKKEKIAIAIDRDSLDLYKRYAKQHNAKYLTMVNGVLTSCADKFLGKYISDGLRANTSHFRKIRTQYRGYFPRWANY